MADGDSSVPLRARKKEITMTEQAANSISNFDDYSLLREFLSELLRSNPFSRYGVHGVGVGRKEVDGTYTDDLAVRFHVAYKVPPSRLLPEQRIPNTFQFTSRNQDRDIVIKTDVIESSPGKLHIDPGSVVRPVPGGVSCSGHGDAWPGTGTIGGWVWDNTDGTIVMLSNQHVFGNVKGTPVIQPGSADGGLFPQHVVGVVKRSVPLNPYAPYDPSRPEDYPVGCNFVDAAIAEADSSNLFDLTILEIGPAVYEIADPELEMVVEKFGQTTGHTSGVITDFPYAMFWSFPVEGTVLMCDCFRFQATANLPLSSNGDSGSLVVKAGRSGHIKPVVGLLFGGGSHAPNNWSVACQITEVFRALDLGPLCIAGCRAWFDALYPREAEGQNQSATTDIGPVQFTSRERQRQQHFHIGLTHDLQKRLLTSHRGRGIISLINRHRSELMTLLVHDGDTRRSLVSALRPILVGAITTTDVLEHRLTEGEVRQLRKLINVGNRTGSASLRKSLKSIQGLLDGAPGQTLAEVLGIKL
jgi:hypothetical protein